MCIRDRHQSRHIALLCDGLHHKIGKQDPNERQRYLHRDAEPYHPKGSSGIALHLSQKKQQISPKTVLLFHILSSPFSLSPVSYTHLDVYKRQGGYSGKDRL